ncbi:MAG TPA: type II secretion system F family protein [Candidatus Paceibacterota bacterium]
MLFTYTARNTTGALVEGVIEEPTKTEAIITLRETGLTPITVTEKKKRTLTLDGIFKRVKLSEKIIFTKNLAGMLRAGLPLARALVVLKKQTTNNYFKTILESLIASIDNGETFSAGLSKYPAIFSSLFVAMVKAGEESGGLPEALMEVGGNLEKSYNLNRKIKSALMYPAIIIVAIFIIGILMFIYVVPVLTKTFKELNVDLPTSTRIVVWVSDMISNHIAFLLLGIAVIVVGGYFAFKRPAVQKFSDYMSTRVPVVGVLVQEVNAARTARTLSSLLVAGVSISRAIGITKEVLQNSYYKSVLAEIEERVEKGETMSSVLQRHTNLYPVMVGEMVAVGEETGKLANMLLDIAVFYEAEVDAKTKDLSTIIEPVLMIFIGGAVGFFAISMLSPMYSLMDSIQ